MRKGVCFPACPTYILIYSTQYLPDLVLPRYFAP